jgi:hypothetical protein
MPTGPASLPLPVSDDPTFLRAVVRRDPHSFRARPVGDLP